MRRLHAGSALGAVAALCLALTACSSSSGDPGAATSAPAPATSAPAPVTSAPAPTDAASPSPSAPAADSPFLYAGADRQAFLEACAAKEVSVTWYTSLAGNIIDAMISAFNKQYPDIAVDTFRADEATISGRVKAELDANQLQGDVLEVTSDSFRQLNEVGAMAGFTSPVLKDISERFTIKDAAGNVAGVGDRTSLVGFGYNTDELPAADIPKSLDDLLNPNLKGKMSITSSTTGIRFIGNILQVKGDTEGRAFLEKLKEQGVKVESVSGAALAGMIATGEAVASPGIFRNHTLQQQDSGNPMEWQPIEPVTANVGYAGVFAAANHPCAGQLFLDFVLGLGWNSVYNALWPQSQGLL
jgi:iron(III) transport system substrate-binding protein